MTFLDQNTQRDLICISLKSDIKMVALKFNSTKFEIEYNHKSYIRPKLTLKFMI